MNLHPKLDARHGLAFTLGLILALAFVASWVGCTAPQHLTVTCVPQVIETAQGPWATGDSVCTWLDTTTGEGGPGRHP